jgi:protoporphyrinogen oxidase
MTEATEPTDAPRPDSEHWAIVGGGMLGMHLALRLAQRGDRVTVFDGAPEAGGLAAAWQLPVEGGPSIQWDRHYHVILGSDTATLGLLDEIGLRDEVRWGATRTACFADGALHEVTTPLQFLRLPTLPFVDRCRIGLSMAVATVTRDAEALDRIHVGTWLTRWAGSRAYERFWLPLLRAKLGDAHQQASAAFIWATVQRLAKARRQGLEGEQFGHVVGGYAMIIDALVGHLRGLGVVFHTGQRVTHVERRSEDGSAPSTPGGALEVTTRDGVVERFDRVVCTANGPLAAGLLTGLTAAERSALQGIPYQGVVCASVLLRRPLAGFYLTNITDGDELTGVVEMTSLVDPAEIGGHHLVYLPRYVPPDDPLLTAPDDEIRQRFLAALARIVPSFDAGDVVAFAVSRVPRVFAIPVVGYRRHVLPFTTSVPGVHLVHSAQIVHGTLNVNETIELAERALPAIVAARPDHARHEEHGGR